MQTDIKLQQQDLRIWLQEEFARRCRSNKRYSIRAFARQLDINQSTLTQILNGKRKITAKAIQKFETKMGVKFQLSSPDYDFKYNILSADTFSVISDWYHYAILEMAALNEFKSDAKWISKKLGISSAEAQMAIDRLLRLGLFTLKKNILCRTNTNVCNYTDGVTSGAHKEFQRQVVTKALHAIDLCTSDKKDITSITFPANSKKLKEVREKIKKFRREICTYMEDGNHDTVLQLCVQLYPLIDN